VGVSTDIPPVGPQSAAATKLQILATEHWSLLATRSLTYTESLGRVSMFLGILSGAVIALALVAQADRFGTTFILIAILTLSVVLFSGVATIARLMSLNRDDFRWVIGMNRLRHAYLELHPELEANFITSPFDDVPGALRTLGIDASAGRRLGSALHVFQTLPGMLSVIVAAVAGAIGALIASAFAAPPIVEVLTAAAAFVLVVLLMGIWSRRSFRRDDPTLAPSFPSPKR
jgi:small basic protein